MLKSYLQEKFEYNEPIFLNEINVEGLSDNAVRHSIKRLTESGFLQRYDTGIYYIPKPGKLLNHSYLDPLMVIMRKYIKNRTETYGYITGISFANQLGLTTQIPAIIEVVTNKEATNGRTVTVGQQKVRIKHPPMTVSAKNAELLQLLDCIGQADKYSELSQNETIDKITKYIKSKNFTKEQLSTVTAALTGSTAKKLIEWGIIYEFAP